MHMCGSDLAIYNPMCGSDLCGSDLAQQELSLLGRGGRRCNSDAFPLGKYMDFPWICALGCLTRYTEQLVLAPGLARDCNQ